MREKSVAMPPASRASIAWLAVGFAATAAAQPIRPAPAFKGNALVGAGHSDDAVSTLLAGLAALGDTRD